MHKTGIRIGRLFFLLLLIASRYVAAQTYDARAPLPPAPQDGFYAIPITPVMGSLLQAGFPDIRILDAKGEEVPYLQQSEERFIYRTVFRELTFTRQIIPGLSRLEIQNTGKEARNHFKLELANVAAQKMMRISGSDDGNTWFLVLDRYLLSVSPDAGKTEVTQMLSFPLTRYSRYRIDIDDSLSAPLNIQKVLVSGSSAASGKYARIAPPQLVQTDSADKSSYVFLHWDAAYTIDQLMLQMETPPFYHRNYTVLRLDSAEVKHHWQYNYTEIGSGTLDSRSAPLILLPSVKLSSCIIRISNDDNPPLHVKAVQPSQLTHYLVSWLKKDEKYQVVMGAPVNAPGYDLEFFKDKIPATLPLLEAGALLMQPQEVKTPEKDEGNKLVWAGLSVLIVLIFVVSNKMLRDMRRKDRLDA